MIYYESRLRAAGLDRAERVRVLALTDEPWLAEHVTDELADVFPAARITVEPADAAGPPEPCDLLVLAGTHLPFSVQTRGVFSRPAAEAAFLAVLVLNPRDLTVFPRRRRIRWWVAGAAERLISRVVRRLRRLILLPERVM